MAAAPCGSFVCHASHPPPRRTRRRKVRSSRRDAHAWASLPPLPCSSSPQPTHCVGLGWGPQELGGQKTGPLPLAAAPCGSFGCHASRPPPRRAVRLLPGVQRFALLEVEESVHTQVLRHVALVVAKSAPVGTPLPGHPSLRSLAPPLPNRPTALGSVGDPRSWATQKAGPLPLAAAPCGSFSCHASRPPPRRTAHRSAKNSFGLRPNCFFVCAAHGAPAPGRSALRLT